MISPNTTKDLHTLEAETRAARLQALRRWAFVLVGYVLLSLCACGGGDPEDEERPCVVDGKTYKPEVCR